MDRIHIRRFPLRCVVGVCRRERKAKRTVYVSLVLDVDLGPSERSDRLEDTVDYAAVLKRIASEAGASRHHLLEALAGHVASICMVDRRVNAVEVTVEKKSPVGGRVAAEIRRSQTGG